MNKTPSLARSRSSAFSPRRRAATGMERTRRTPAGPAAASGADPARRRRAGEGRRGGRWRARRRGDRRGDQGRHRAIAADDHRGRQPALRRIGHVASRESPGASAPSPFQEGQRVTKGTPLVQARCRDHRRPSVQQARANLTLAKSKFDRAVDLAKRNFISGQAKDEAENNLKVAEAVAAARRGASSPRPTSARRSPASSACGSVSVGDYVKEGADLVNLEADRSAQGRLSRAGDLSAPGAGRASRSKIALDALPGKTYDGTVRRGESADRRGGPLDRHPRPGAQPGHRAAPGHVRAREAHHRATSATRWCVPEQALVPQGTEQFVFKVVDGKVDARQGRDRPASRRQGGDPQRRDGRRHRSSRRASCKLRDGLAVQGAPDRLRAEPAKARRRPRPSSERCRRPSGLRDPGQRRRPRRAPKS